MLDIKNVTSHPDLPDSDDENCYIEEGRKSCRKYSIGSNSWNSINSADHPVSYRVNFSRNEGNKQLSAKSCPQRRTHKMHYEKTPLHAKVANFRDCHFLLENRPRNSCFLRPDCDEFYLGIESPSDLDSFLTTTQISTKRDQSFYYDFLTQKFNCRGASFWRGTRRKSFMQLVGQMPVYQRTYPQSAGSEEGRRKRDWILVKYLTKVMDADGQEEGKMWYHQTGDQQLIYCPSSQRTVNEVEGICCQSFLNKTKDEMVRGNRIVELLFSPQGPVLRDDKHLTGRSVMYFCCHEPNTSMRKVERSQVVTAVVKQKRADRSITSTQSPHPPRYVDPPVERAATTSEVTKSKQTCASTTTPAAVSQRKEKKQTSPKSPKDVSKTSFNFEEKKSVLMEEPVGGNNQRLRKRLLRTRLSYSPKHVSKLPTCIYEPRDMVMTDEADDEVFEQDEPPSIETPPIKLRPPKLRVKEEKAAEKPKRRESTTISIIAAPITKKNPPPKKSPPSCGGKPFDFPDFKNFDVFVKFDGECYSEEFLEHKTLQDIYIWIKTKLLSFCKIRYGSELLLSIEDKTFPLKPDTANTPVSSFPALVFDCLELQKEAKQSNKKYNSDNSRFDAHFGLPIDMRELQSLNPLTYMAKHCSVSRAWEAFYKNVFKNHLKIRQTCLRYHELNAAIEKLYAKLSSSVLCRVLFLLGFDSRAKEFPEKSLDDLLHDGTSEEPWKDDLLIDEELFVGICALSNRIICCESSIDGIFVGSIKQKDQNLEVADFYNIEEKLSSLRICPILKRLLLYVRKKS